MTTPAVFTGFVPEKLSQSSLDLPSAAADSSIRPQGRRRKLSLRRASSFRGFRRSSQPVGLSSDTLSQGLRDTQSRGKFQPAGQPWRNQQGSRDFRRSARGTGNSFQRFGGIASSQRFSRYRPLRGGPAGGGSSELEAASGCGSGDEVDGGTGGFVRSVAKRCSVRLRERSSTYRKHVNKQLHRIPTQLLKSVFTSAARSAAAAASTGPVLSTTAEQSQQENTVRL